MTSDTGTQGEGSGSAALLRRTPDALDAERLTAAFWNVTAKRLPIPAWGSPEAEQYREKALADAAEIIAEYARLGE